MPKTAILCMACFALLSGARADGGRKIVFFKDSIAVDRALLTAYTIFLYGKPDSAHSLYVGLLQNSREMGYRYGIASSILGMGNILAKKGNYSAAMKYFKELLRYCDTGDRTAALIPVLYNNMANIHCLRGNDIVAIRNLEAAIRFGERRPSSIPLEMLYNNIGSLLTERQLSRALDYLQKGLLLARTRDNYVAQALLLYNLGDLYCRRGEFVKGEALVGAAYRLSLKEGFKDIQHSVLVNMAVNANRKEQPYQALDYLAQSDSLRCEPDVLAKVFGLFAKGKAYFLLKDYKNAEHYLVRMIADAYSRQLIHKDMAEACHIVADILAARGRPAEALVYQAREMMLKDSIHARQKVEAVLHTEARFRSVQKDKEIAQKQLIIEQQQNSIRTRNIGMLITTVVLVLLAALLLIIRKNYRHKQDLKDEKMQRLQRQQQLSEMKAIINGEEKERTRIARDLHDGIMVRLAATKMHISALVGHAGQPIDALQLMPVLDEMDVLSAELRSTAHNLMPDMLLQEGLAYALYYFCRNLEKNTTLKVVFERLSPIPRFEPQTELSIYRIIQELMQNILKHAQAAEAYIQMNYDNRQLSITVEDNGIGMTEPGRNRMGMGIRNITARVLSLNGFIELNSRLEYGTSVNIELGIPPFVPVSL